MNLSNILAHWRTGFTPAFPNGAVIQREVRFVDISYYQKNAHFSTMKTAGAQGVILRAGQRTWPDIAYAKFRKDARLGNFPTGTYWFFDSRTKPKEQAKKWHDIIGDDVSLLKDWADYEESYGGDYRGWRKLSDFLEYSKEEMPGRTFGIYTGFWYWLSNSPNPIKERANLDYFGKYPLWEAYYTKSAASVKIPAPWTSLWGWQYGFEDGILHGVDSKEIDGDVFNGSQADWDSMVGKNQSENKYEAYLSDFLYGSDYNTTDYIAGATDFAKYIQARTSFPMYERRK